MKSPRPRAVPTRTQANYHAVVVLTDAFCRDHLPLCQRSCRLNRIGTFGGADSRKWLDTDKRTKIG